MILQCLIIFACLAVGEVVIMLTGIKFPSSIIGMILLCTLLKTEVVKYDKIKGMANFLISNMGFFFIPPGIALMLYFDISLYFSKQKRYFVYLFYFFKFKSIYTANPPLK